MSPLPTPLATPLTPHSQKMATPGRTPLPGFSSYLGIVCDVRRPSHSSHKNRRNFDKLCDINWGGAGSRFQSCKLHPVTANRRETKKTSRHSTRRAPKLLPSHHSATQRGKERRGGVGSGAVGTDVLMSVRSTDDELNSSLVGYM